MPSKSVEFRYFKTQGFSFEIVKKDVGEDYEREFTNEDSGYFYSRKELNGGVPFLRDNTTFFQFFAKKNGGNVYERSMRVNATSGNIEDVDAKNLCIDSIIEREYCLSFGLYDSDSGGISGLTNSHQVWATITPNRSEWQKQLFEQVSTDKVKLKNLVLPGSHDAGMFQSSGVIAVDNLAKTQKESIRQQLLLGARFFDVRPAAIKSDLSNIDFSFENNSFGDFFAKIGKGTLTNIMQGASGVLRHIHMLIPGCTYEEFLRDIVDFLNQHKNEIVVVKISQSGIDNQFCDIPSYSDVVRQTEEMLKKKFSGNIKIGNRDSLEKSIKSLVENNERVILIDNDGSKIVSSYSDDYGSFDSQVIVNSLNKVNSACQKGETAGKMLVDLQLQLTATNVGGAIARAATGTHIATSPLLATKSRTDVDSYNWLSSNLPAFSTNLPLVSLINDFYDNGLTEVAYQANLKRLKNL